MNPFRRIGYAITRAFLRTLGRASDGVRLCLDTGLTSGKMVDYVYRNQPSGRFGFGNVIDRRFLADPGWEAVRQRRANLERLMGEAIDRLRSEGRRAHLLDLASGPGAYILAAVKAAGEGEITACCRDFDARWVAEGQAEAARLGLSQVQFQEGDAFDRESVLALEPQPTCFVSSGFYDWITDDELVKRSLGLAFEVLEPGGFLVLTNQVSHPDLEFVSAVFTDFHHAPLRMKMRPAQVIHQWLADLGFSVEKTLADPKGYYSVTLARKPQE